MSDLGEGIPNEKVSNKPPKRQWAAAEPWFDFKASHWVEIFLTAALVFVGLMQLKVYWRQARIMDSQTRIAENANAQNAITNRAFVTSNEVNIKEERKNGIMMGWTLHPIVVNSGNTPTVNLEYHVTRTEGTQKWTEMLAPTYPIGGHPTLTDPEQEYYNLGVNPTNPRAPENRIHHLVLGAHATATIGRIELNAEQVIPDTQGIFRAYIGAVIHYRDQIDPTVEHVTKFCYSIHMDSQISDDPKPVYDLCDYWNCIDDECSKDEDQYRAEVKRIFQNNKKEVPIDFYGPPVWFLIEPTYDMASNKAQELARVADTHKYLSEPSIEAAWARSAELWQVATCGQISCNPAKERLLEARPMTDGRAVLVMPTDTREIAIISKPNGTGFLTEVEQAAIKSAKQIGASLVELEPPPTVGLFDGTGAVVLPTGQTSNLTPGEIVALRPDTEMGPLLPYRYRYRTGKQHHDTSPSR